MGIEITSCNLVHQIKFVCFFLIQEFTEIFFEIADLSLFMMFTIE
jgi:hypothetical protein